MERHAGIYLKTPEELEEDRKIWLVGRKKRRNEGSWRDRLQELKEFKKDNGHCDVPTEYDLNQPLANWVSWQRQQYKLYREEGSKSALTSERVDALEEVGFRWEVQDSSWRDRLQELKDFKDANGHCYVPRRYNPNQSLANWVQRQRQQYKLYCTKDKSSSLTPERLNTLEEIGFCFSGTRDA